MAYSLCGNETATFIMTKPAKGNVIWSTTAGLSIISGQNSSTVKVKASGNGQGAEKVNAKINTLASEGTYVDVNMASVRYITGPSYGKSGTSLYFQAEPIYPSSFGTYNWSVSPSTGVFISKWQYQAQIQFANTGSYTVKCSLSTDHCGVQTTPALKTVSIGLNYSVYSDNLNVHIKPIEYSKSFSGKMDYQLFDNASGRLYESGKISNSGGTLNFSKFKKGFYILILIFEDGSSSELADKVFVTLCFALYYSKRNIR